MGMDNTENNNLKHPLKYEGPCPFCGFLLKNPTNNRCPECGRVLEITLRSPFKMTAWLVVLIGIVSSVVGYLNHLGLLLFGVFLASRSRLTSPLGRGDLTVPWKIVIPELVALAVLVILLFTCWGLRDWFSKQHKLVRMGIGTLGFLLPFVSYQYMIWFILRN
ncbi:MAG: hypothetical protein QF718_07610 [Phycisphaerales bacterium]|jgi:hypothetical protein|nr:hypothetical protein [Phycisphaerales bacterium]